MGLARKAGRRLGAAVGRTGAEEGGKMERPRLSRDGPIGARRRRGAAAEWLRRAGGGGPRVAARQVGRRRLGRGCSSRSSSALARVTRLTAFRVGRAGEAR